MTGGSFSAANMRNTSLRGAQLQAVGDLNAASVSGADFENADFRQASLNGVQFFGTNLVNANFQATAMQGTDFTGAVLANAAFSCPDGISEERRVGTECVMPSR